MDVYINAFRRLIGLFSDRSLVLTSGRADPRNSWQQKKRGTAEPKYDKENPLPPHNPDHLKATKKGEQSSTQFARYADKTAKELGKSALSLFKELDVDDSGGLSSAELKGYKSLLFTGKSHTERDGTEQKYGEDDKRRDPRYRPKSKGGDLPDAPGHDLSLEEFTTLYKDKVTNEKQPHGKYTNNRSGSGSGSCSGSSSAPAVLSQECL